MADEFASNSERTHRKQPTLTRREAMMQLLRVGGIAAGATGAGFWLSERSTRPVPALPNRRGATIASAPIRAKPL